MRHFKQAFVLAAMFSAVASAAQPVTTLAPRNGTIRLAVVGDAGDGTTKVALGLAAIHAAQPLDGILLPGDNLYPCGAKSITDPAWTRLQPLFDLGLPMFPVLGNHDWCGNPDAEIDFSTTLDRWRFPARQYVLEAGVADIAMIDTTPFVRGKEPAPDFAALFAQSHTPWRIVTGHHTIVSSGFHGYFPRRDHRRMLTLLKPMRAAHVDLYVCGHDHHLELIAGNPRLLVSGASSDPIAPVSLHLHTVFPNDTRREAGFAVIEMTASKMSVTFYDLRGRQLAPPLEWMKK